MKNTNWKDFAELIGIAAIVASLVFVGIQLKQEQEIALTQITQSSVERIKDLDLAMSEHADIWVKSNKGEELSEQELVVMQGLIDAWHRWAVSTALQRRRFDQNASSTTSLLAIRLYQNPGAARIWLKLTEDESRFYEQLNPGDNFIYEIREEIRNKMEELERRNAK